MEFVDRTGRAIVIPERAAQALRQLLARPPSRRVMKGAPGIAPIAMIRDVRARDTVHYEYHGRFVLLRPTDEADGGIWEDPLLEKWEERYRKNNYLVSPEIFSD